MLAKISARSHGVCNGKLILQQVATYILKCTPFLLLQSSRNVMMFRVLGARGTWRGVQEETLGSKFIFSTPHVCRLLWGLSVLKKLHKTGESVTQSGGWTLMGGRSADAVLPSDTRFGLSLLLPFKSWLQNVRRFLAKLMMTSTTCWAYVNSPKVDLLREEYPLPEIQARNLDPAAGRGPVKPLSFH